MKIYYSILVSCLFLFQMCSPKTVIISEEEDYAPSIMHPADTIEPELPIDMGCVIHEEEFPPPPIIDSLNVPAQWTYDWYASFEQYLAYHVEYPRELRDEAEKWNGKVKFSYIIRTDGSVSDIKILASPHELHSKQVMNAISEMPVSWEAEKKGGQFVASVYEGEIKFDFDF